jgi:hypothetical protein
MVELFGIRQRGIKTHPGYEQMFCFDGLYKAELHVHESKSSTAAHKCTLIEYGAERSILYIYLCSERTIKARTIDSLSKIACDAQ